MVGYSLALSPELVMPLLGRIKFIRPLSKPTRSLKDWPTGWSPGMSWLLYGGTYSQNGHRAVTRPRPHFANRGTSLKFGKTT